MSDDATPGEWGCGGMDGQLSEREQWVTFAMARARRAPEPEDDLAAMYRDGWLDGAYSIVADLMGDNAAQRCEQAAIRLARTGALAPDAEPDE